MIRNLAAISVLTLAAIANFCTITQAQTNSGAVSFNGNVQSQCTVTTISNGTLIGNASPLATGFVTQSPGIVTARCNSEGAVISIPSQAGTNPKQLSLISSFLPLDTIPGDGSEKTLSVSMIAGNSSVIPAGTYNFTVTVTVTP